MISAVRVARRLLALAPALALVPLPAAAQGLPTGKRRHGPVAVEAAGGKEPAGAASQRAAGEGVRTRGTDGGDPGETPGKRNVPWKAREKPAGARVGVRGWDYTTKERVTGAPEENASEKGNDVGIEPMRIMHEGLETDGEAPAGPEAEGAERPEDASPRNQSDLEFVKERARQSAPPKHEATHTIQQRRGVGE